MGLDSKELSLDLNCGFSPKYFSDLLAEVSLIDDIPKKLSKFNDYVYVLEQEMRKVDAFKRELPFCMLLLNDAIVKLKAEVFQLKRRGGEGVRMEKFMPLKGNFDEEGGPKLSAERSDKKNWMSSVQLWSTPIQCENDFDNAKDEGSVVLREPRYKERDDGVMRRSPFEGWNFNNKGKGLVPFKKRNSGTVKMEEEDDLAVDGLSLSMPVAEMGSEGEKSLKGETVASHDYGVSEDSSSQQQSKKQRRCWSQELHQSFVNALLELGGAQAATPKQIREIMQVDSLTNDEVKSHLQKYRLHIRKLQTSSSSGALPNLRHWSRREECGHMTTPGVAQSGSPEGPLHIGGSAKGISVTGGESVEEEEDVKSESHSWKGRFHGST